MFQPRFSADRGAFDHGWLQTRHTFSFGEYHDPDQMGFRALRVINEDVVAPGQGFGMHGHRDMEIVTIVLSGALEHRDSLGHGEVLRPGELQRMSAGSGIRHSEFNPSATEPVHLYQIWLMPDRRGVTPRYEQKRFDPEQRRGRWQLVASPDAAEGSLSIYQDARIFLANVTPGQAIDFRLADGRHAWLQVLSGEVEVSGQRSHAGDGVAVSREAMISVHAIAESELLLFDLP